LEWKRHFSNYITCPSKSTYQSRTEEEIKILILTLRSRVKTLAAEQFACAARAYYRSKLMLSLSIEEL